MPGPTQLTGECSCVLLELMSVVTANTLLVVSRGEQSREKEEEEEEQEEEEEEDVTAPVDEVLATFRLMASLVRKEQDLSSVVLAKVTQPAGQSLFFLFLVLLFSGS